MILFLYPAFSNINCSQISLFPSHRYGISIYPTIVNYRHSGKSFQKLNRLNITVNLSNILQNLLLQNLLWWFSNPCLLYMTILLCKAKRQYLLTCKVSRYCLLALHGSIVVYNQFYQPVKSLLLGTSIFIHRVHIIFYNTQVNYIDGKLKRVFICNELQLRMFSQLNTYENAIIY